MKRATKLKISRSQKRRWRKIKRKNSTYRAALEYIKAMNALGKAGLI